MPPLAKNSTDVATYDKTVVVDENNEPVSMIKPSLVENIASVTRLGSDSELEIFAAFAKPCQVPGAGAAIGVLAQLVARNAVRSEAEMSLILQKIKDYMKEDAKVFWQYCIDPQEDTKAKCSTVPKQFLGDLKKEFGGDGIALMAVVEECVYALVRFNEESELMRKLSSPEPKEEDYYVQVPASATDKDVVKALAKCLLQKQCALLKRNYRGMHTERIARIALQEGKAFDAFKQGLDDETEASALQRIGNVLCEYGPPWAKGECDIALIMLRYVDGMC